MSSISSLDPSPCANQLTRRNSIASSDLNNQKMQNLLDSQNFLGEYKKKLKDGTTKTYRLSEMLKDYEDAQT